MSVDGIALLVLSLTVIALTTILVVAIRRSGPLTHEADDAEVLQDRLWLLAESEERYRTLIEATTECIVQRDDQGRITFANEGFAAMLGARPIDLLGSSVQLPILESGEVVQRPDGVRQIEERVLPVDGRPRWFSFIEMPVQGTGGAPHWLRAGSDVTARIEAVRSLDEAKSRAESANIAKSRFLATVSHEFRTPLNGILGMADLVLETGLDAEQRTYVEAVQTSGRALLTLVDGILDFSRIEAGKLDLASEPFDIAATVEGVVELMAPRAQDKGLEIALDVAEDFRCQRVGDADRVRQILLNLAGNAIKFTETGGVGVSLSQADEAVVLSIEDTGPGIPEERIPMLFEEFEQGDGSASRSHEGTGLGLAITQRLVDRMGGRIEVNSKPGRGSTFRVILPLPLAGDEVAVRAPSLRARKVLIAADSPFQAPYLARRLSRSGAAAVIVPSVEAALDALDGAGFDAVIADRSLGDADVRRLAAEARRSGVRCSLILLSPFDRREFGAPGAAGFDSYLIKPVRARSLFDRLLEPGAGPAAETSETRPAPRSIPAQPAMSSTAKGRHRPGTGKRVLLAEDNAINALLATKALERLGATVTLARDGIEAVAAVEAAAEPFDLALIDIRMPGLDGLGTIRRIRALEAAGAPVPHLLVALTANAAGEDERVAREAGFDDFLPKPLDLKALPGLLEWRSQAA
ncbi:PAS domain-containing hybrid sensor histidine kinase/response regulator [Methylobacterium gnaphalii]|uniref:Sensory/regulatory protein RpfC n=1 Tax=Methylobacterium gnaphalii TaxID=1010610 RepID=A0A512JGW5_9HYPH|nr:ATP-binding protein [Methylobacterium gnaphalii]GEP09185.1 hybrid sensor histidine kinase/response regulator [Methylobacterium gnaphalii]GJD67597.1 Sensor histidine kinase RcsC [Methylobacterium gnaphalii]